VLLLQLLLLLLLHVTWSYSSSVKPSHSITWSQHTFKHSTASHRNVTVFMYLHAFDSGKQLCTCQQQMDRHALHTHTCITKFFMFAARGFSYFCEDTSLLSVSMPAKYSRY
jgi:hypothetical protein